MVEGNDTIKVESFDSLEKVVIKDPSVKDLDVMTIALSDKTTNVFRAEMENIETLHVDVSGAFDKAVQFSANPVSGLKTLEFAGSTNGAIRVNAAESNLPNGVTKIDASNVTGGFVVFDANDTSVTTLIGGANNDNLTIGSEGGTLTGGQGSDTFNVGSAKDKSLVTITDIASKDTINFGANAIQSGLKAVELTVAESADETTFIANLQKAADDKGVANQLYYGTYNGNTYVIANGQAGGAKVTANTFNFAGSVSGVTITISASVTAATGSVNLTGVAASGASSITLTKAENGLFVSGVTLTKGGLTYQGHTFSNISGESAGVFGVTGVTDSSGNEYKLSQFDAYYLLSGGVATSSVTAATGATATVTGTLDIPALSNANSTASASVAITSGVLTSQSNLFEGVLKGDVFEDDIIVKLIGTHNMTTEANAVSLDINNNALVTFI